MACPLGPLPGTLRTMDAARKGKRDEASPSEGTRRTRRKCLSAPVVLLPTGTLATKGSMTGSVGRLALSDSVVRFVGARGSSRWRRDLRWTEHPPETAASARARCAGRVRCVSLRFVRQVSGTHRCVLVRPSSPTTAADRGSAADDGSAPPYSCRLQLIDLQRQARQAPRPGARRARTCPGRQALSAVRGRGRQCRVTARIAPRWRR